MNKSEEITYNLCKKSFLSLWSFANPLRADGKELCDILVVFDRHIVIFSVKDIQFAETVDAFVASRRWERRAVRKSAKQIYNAERWITQSRSILTTDKKAILLPDPKHAEIHRVAVALGSKGMVPIVSGDVLGLGKGYVHVYDELSMHRTMQELDTITDFVAYLAAVETLITCGKVVLNASQDDLLASYLQNNRTFPLNFDTLIVEGGIWDEFDRRPEVKKRREEDRISYLWDGIIEEFSESIRKGTLELDGRPGETELVLRTMAKENRFSRRILGQQIADIVETPKTKRRSKILQAQSGIIYVLHVSEKSRDRRQRRLELEYRCHVAKRMYPSSPIVVGIATEHLDKSGNSFDACYIQYDKWTEEDEKSALEIEEKLGFFRHAEQKHFHMDEYPIVDHEDTAEATHPSETDIRSDKLKALASKFPVTLQYLRQSQEFDSIGQQLTFEGYNDWEIVQAGCNIIMIYRVDPDGKLPNDERIKKLSEYVGTYVETAYSPFPPAGYFVLKKVRSQVHADRATRLVRLKNMNLTTDFSIPIEELKEDREPQNVLYVLTKDNFDLWVVLFPKFDPLTREIIDSKEWDIKIGCDSKDSVSHEFCEALAHDLAKYVTMIDFQLDRLNSTTKKELNVAVVEEELFRELFANTYNEALQGRSGIGDSPIIMSWRDNEGRPHMNLGINKMISKHSRMKRLFYVMCGIFDCIGGMPKPEAAKMAGAFVESLE
ncbi:MAG: hypothetical protein ABSG74_09105 [Candidatus Bathyarchaeia archaeon]|jgi:hypothetical protein